MAAVTICSDFGAPQRKSLTVYAVSPSICCEVMGLDATYLWCIMAEKVRPLFFLPSPTKGLPS